MAKKTKHRTIRAVAYTRKSTNKGLDSNLTSLDVQRNLSIQLTEAKGWKFVPTKYDDGGYSGSTLKRPALQRLLRDAEDGKFDKVVCYKYDRISRDNYESLWVEKHLERLGVEIVSVTEPIGNGDPMGRALRDMSRVFAQLEREMAAARTRDRTWAARRGGRWTGGHPQLGYDLHPDGGLLLTNQEEAERVRQINRLYLRHGSLRRTCEVLQERGWTMKAWTTRNGKPTGGQPFTKASLQRLLTNVLYIGKITCGDEIHEGQHEAIVPTALFDRVQSLLDENRRTRGAATRNKHGFLLRGRVACSACGASRTANTTRKGPLAYKYYVCSSAQRHGYGTCPCPSVPAFKLEGLIINQIRAIGREQTLQDQVLEAARTHHEAAQQQLEADLSQMTKKRSTTQDEIKGLLKALADGTVTGTSIASRIAELETTLETHEHKVTDIQAQIDSHSQLRPDPTDLAKSLSVFDEIWEVLLPAEQERVIGLLVESIDYDGTMLGINFGPAGVQLLAEELAPAETSCRRTRTQRQPTSPSMTE